MTDQALTRERNFFLVGFFIIVGINVVFRFATLYTPPDALEGVQSLAKVLTLFAKVLFTYLIFRLSRFLRQPVWLTLIYCVLALIALLYLIPFIGLLIAVKNARRVLSPPAPGGEAGQEVREG